MNHYDFMTKLTKIAPNASDDVDNYGQVIIYTHLKYNDETGEYEEMSEKDFEDEESN